MNVSNVKLIYFSPTGTTKKILAGIAEGIGADTVEDMSLTLPADNTEPTDPLTDTLAVIGAPVYGGRLPQAAVSRLKRLNARNTPAILVVVYGNREFEDALLELTNLSTELGFIPVCGAAFIGEHSFATKELPIAEGRPDNEDIKQATAFGKAVKEKLSALDSLDNLSALKVPGNMPYKDSMAPNPAIPAWVSDNCTMCGVCVDVCPTGAVTMNASVETDADLCIKCCACIKECPADARVMENPFITNITKWLYENCSRRKEPEIFL